MNVDAFSGSVHSKAAQRLKCLNAGTSHYITHQWRRTRNMIGGGAGVRGCEAPDYPREASACEGQKLGGLKPP